MRELILIIFYWMHLSATVIWIGGITFILLIAIPSTKQVLGAEAGKLMGDISKRFTPFANFSIICLIVTGLVLTWFNKHVSETGFSENIQTSGLILKHVLVFGMVVVHFYRGLVLNPKIVKTTSIDEKAALQKLSLNLVKVNFALGLLVLLLSGVIAVII